MYIVVVYRHHKTPLRTITTNHHTKIPPHDTTTQHHHSTVVTSTTTAPTNTIQETPRNYKELQGTTRNYKELQETPPQHIYYRVYRKGPKLNICKFHNNFNVKVKFAALWPHHVFRPILGTTSDVLVCNPWRWLR